jgi:AcrR family transcriptional regulator
MADTLDTAKPTRRRRSDARRSIDAILNAARTVLGERPDASMEDIATAAGVTRQTVYVHFPSRDALIAALLHAAGAETVAAIDAARLDTVPPADALRQFLDIGWQLLRRNPYLLGPALTRNPPGSNDPHQTGTARLEQIIRRGQRAGDFDRTLPATWLTAAILGLFRTAAEQVAAGRLTTSKAAPMLLDSTLRLCGAAGAGGQSGVAPAADLRADDHVDRRARHRTKDNDRSAGRTTPT